MVDTYVCTRCGSADYPCKLMVIGSGMPDTCPYGDSDPEWELVVDDSTQSEVKQHTLKLGQLVRIHKDLKLGHYGAETVTPQMLEYAGKYAVITEYCYRGKDLYKISVDEGHWTWSREMFVDDSIQTDSHTGLDRAMRVDLDVDEGWKVKNSK